MLEKQKGPGKEQGDGMGCISYTPPCISPLRGQGRSKVIPAVEGLELDYSLELGSGSGLRYEAQSVRVRVGPAI